MAVFRPFEGVRPVKEKAGDVAALPYDVMNSDEARVMAEGNPWSFLHVDKAILIKLLIGNAQTLYLILKPMKTSKKITSQ